MREKEWDSEIEGESVRERGGKEGEEGGGIERASEREREGQYGREQERKREE